MLSAFVRNQKVRFLAVGGVNTLVGFGLYTGFYFLLGANLYIAAFLISYVIALFSSFVLYRLLVFKEKGYLVLDFLRYSLVSVTSTFLVNIIMLPLAVEVFSLNPLLAQAVIVVFIVVFNYFAHRYFSFYRKKDPFA